VSDRKTVILGIKYIGHDATAALLIDGKIVAACEQERYTRDKHSSRFPIDAINDCLKLGGVTLDEVDEIATNNEIDRLITQTYLQPAIADPSRIGILVRDMERIRRFYTLPDKIREETGYKGPVTCYRHHLCHVASSYFPSGFNEALCVSYDGLAEFETGLLASGIDGKIEVLHDRNNYPNSLGLLYSGLTDYLGWKHHYDEGIIMGLAPYGDPNARIPGSSMTYLDVFTDILRETGPYDFEVDQTWMSYYYVRDKWVGDRFFELMGPKRVPGSEITQHHKNIAAALQARLEQVVLNQLRHARKEFGFSRLALAGGVALNCSLNGRILREGIFDEIFVQPGSGDSGTTIGACYLGYMARGHKLKPRREHNFYLGSAFSPAETRDAFKAAGVRFSEPDNLFEVVARKLAEGKIVGWMQGRAEFGPRALGNRSILCRPFPAAMKDHLNARVKFREEFRPFAPAVLGEHASSHFHIAQESPHMLMAVNAVSPFEKIAATVHVDESCRVQTVYEKNNPPFRKLLEAFFKETGVPVLLNTSFNVKGQPIVNSPKDAIDCFLSTNIDCLVVESCLAEKPDNPQG
jgi:carbamoyltransferase